jgi:hypothetical protein
MRSLAIGGMLVFSLAANARAVVIIDGTTHGFYNAAIGQVLDGSNPCCAPGTFLFPGGGDPTIDPVPFEPTLNLASGALGNWLGDPGNLNANWSGPQAIPGTWAINAETAVIYTISGYTNVNASFGIDNGIFVWLDGAFVGGQMAPLGPMSGEFTANLGDLSNGTHYLQILREDHGGATGYLVAVTGDPAVPGDPVPEPTTLALLGAGLAAVGARRRRSS